MRQSTFLSTYRREGVRNFDLGDCSRRESSPIDGARSWHITFNQVRLRRIQWIRNGMAVTSCVIAVSSNLLETSSELQKRFKSIERCRHGLIKCFYLRAAANKTCAEIFASSLPQAAPFCHCFVLFLWYFSIGVSTGDGSHHITCCHMHIG